MEDQQRTMTTIHPATEHDAAHIARYARHILLAEIGGPGQQRLRNARLAIVGVGGLGGPAALYLAAAGVGYIRLIDDDTVSLSNLQRQILFDTPSIGTSKTEAGARRLRALNPDCTIDARAERLGPDNAADLLEDCRIILDGSDSFATRFVVNDACLVLKATLISGAVGRWQAQLSVFAYPDSPCYRCLVAEAPDADAPCAEIGIAGPLTGIVGARMALEAIKEITGAGDSLSGRLWLFNGLDGSERTALLRRDPACPACGKGYASDQ